MLRKVLLLAVAACALAPVGGVWAAPADSPDLVRAYFLEHEARDFTAARVLYEKARSAAPDDETRQAATRGANRCRDALAAQDFSTLMPPDALGYVEITRPGQIFEKLAAMIGLTAPDMQEIFADRPSAESGSMAFVPPRVAISPAIFQALSAFGGAAFAVTDIDPGEKHAPSGVLVLHHGDTQMCRGLLETAFQFAPTAKKIEGLPTFSAYAPDVGRLTGVLTESLLIVGTTHELASGVVHRLLNEGEGSLGRRPDLAELAARRRGSTIFAFCDLQKSLQLARSHAGSECEDLKKIDALVGLDSFRWAAFSFGVHEGVLNLEATLRLADHHRNIVYNLLRMPPMTRECLALVPQDAAGVFGLGLNPAVAQMAAPAESGDKTDPAVSAFDIGREIFGNIREVCAFVLSDRMLRDEVPNGGLLMAVNDVTRSRALWNQFLSLPGMVADNETAQPRTVKIGSIEATCYTIPDFGKVYLGQIDNCVAVTVSRSAMKACVQARARKQSILNDAAFAATIERMPKATSILGVAHAGRLAKLAGRAEPNMAMATQPASELCSKMIASVAVGEAPNELSVRFSLSGLPNVNDALKKFAPMLNAFIPRVPHSPQTDRADELAARPVKSDRQAP